MIIDKIENAGLYKNISPGIEKALTYLQNTDINILSQGKHLIDGDNIFIIISEYETKNTEDSLLEAHAKYIDVQYVVKGTEQVGVSTYMRQTPIKPYDTENDYMLFDEPYGVVTMHQGMFAVFFPHDMHKPGIAANRVSKVKKAVVKIKM
jgi:YhcH/YjgK/YiaL family protein